MELALVPSAAIMNSINPTAAGAAGRRKSEKNQKFANDGSWDSVRLMLEKFAAKAYKRVSDIGLAWEFDDVMGQMRLGYVQALQKWDPQAGVLFSTYCFSVCRNNFNEAVKKEERERTQLGMYSYDAHAENFDDESVDALDRIPEANDHQMSTEDAIVGREEFQERMRGMSQGARRLITALLTSERVPGRETPPKLRELAASCGLVDDELRQVKAEILTKFGVRWN